MLLRSGGFSMLVAAFPGPYRCLLAVLPLLTTAVVIAAPQEDPIAPTEERPPVRLIEMLVAPEIDPDDIGMDQIDGLGDEDEDPLPSWVDASHAAATNRAQALAQWTDSFFGSPVQDAERSDTFVRVIAADDWDRKDGHDIKFRMRGQVHLPAISKRLDLVFAGNENDDNLGGADTASRSEEAGLRLNLADKRRSRFDATLSVSSGPGIVPGVRYRYQNDISDNSWYRFTQRLQYDTHDGYRSITELGVHRYLGEGALLRWKGRARYREDKGFWDWRSSIIYREWLSDHEEFPSALQYFIGWGGNTDPELATRNFRLGVLFRKQWLRPYLYLEVEPNYTLRKDTFEEKRKWVAGLVLRLEMMLDDDLIR